MGQNHKIPDYREDEPGDIEGGTKTEKGPGPGKVNHGGEEVFQVPVFIFVVFCSPVHIYSPMFGYNSVFLCLGFYDTKDSSRFAGKWVPPEAPCQISNKD